MQAYTFPTVETVVTQAIAETLGSSTSSLTALQTTALIRQVDVLNRKFVMEGHIRHPSGGWSWMEDVTNFQTKSSTTLNGALTTASTSVVFTTDIGFDATNGRIWVKTSKGAIDFIDYATFAVLTASTATDIDMAHASGEKVEKLYALPSNYGKAHKLIVDSHDYEYERAELLPCSGTFSLRGSFMLFPENIGQHDVTFWYEKCPTDLSTGTDATDLATSVDVPHDFMRYLIEGLKAYIFMTRRKAEMAQVALQMAEDAIQIAVSYDQAFTTPTGLKTW